MLDKNELQVLKAILEADPRPWPSVAKDDRKYIAEFHFPLGQFNNMHALADDVRQVGFSASEGEKLALSESAAADAWKLGVLIVESGVGLMVALAAVNEGIKAITELPESLRKLREKIRPYLSQAVELAPAVQLEPVCRWLSSRYGEQWRCNLGKVQAKTILNVTVFSVHEEVSGHRHVLAVRGDEVEELPEDWLKAHGA